MKVQGVRPDPDSRGRSPDGARLALVDAVQARVFAARTLFLLGYPDRARRMIRQAIERAKEAAPPGLATTLAVAATLHYRLRERRPMRERAEEAIAIAQERGLPFPLALARAYRGWALGGPQGLEELQRGVASSKMRNTASVALSRSRESRGRGPSSCEVGTAGRNA